MPIAILTFDDPINSSLQIGDIVYYSPTWKAREAKALGKGKVTVQKTVTIEYNDIKEARVKILF